MTENPPIDDVDILEQTPEDVIPDDWIEEEGEGDSDGDCGDL